MKNLFVILSLLFTVQAQATQPVWRFLNCHETEDTVDSGRLDFYADRAILTAAFPTGEIVTRLSTKDERVDAVVASKIKSTGDGVEITSVDDQLPFDIHITLENGEIKDAVFKIPYPHTPETPLTCKTVPVPFF
jgi:hypothetical protein